MGEEVFRDEPDFHFGIPEPMLEVLTDNGRELPWSPRGAGAGDGESDGEAEVWDLPETGELRVTVDRLAADAYGPDGGHLGEGASVDGPWDFRFSL
jgi:hypothetical protein